MLHRSRAPASRWTRSWRALLLPRGRRTQLTARAVDEMLAFDRAGTCASVVGISMTEPEAARSRRAR